MSNPVAVGVDAEATRGDRLYSDEPISGYQKCMLMIKMDKSMFEKTVAENALNRCQIWMMKTNQSAHSVSTMLARTGWTLTRGSREG